MPASDVQAEPDPTNERHHLTRDASEECHSANVEEDEEEDDNLSDLSLWEDIMSAEDSDGQEGPVTGGCTMDEATYYRRRLKAVGPEDFIEETIRSNNVTARKLVTAFGVRPPTMLDDAPDYAFYPLLKLALQRELSRREKLPQYNTIDDAVSLLQTSNNIIVLTGAGISTSLGIPDFRSKENGLYNQLEGLGLSDPQEVFDIRLFREDPKIFYSVAKDILPSTKRFSPTHAFIRLLQDKGKLLTNFTQNIDNLESHAGIEHERLVQCHGSFATATCIECRTQVPGEAIHKDLKAGQIARCDQCLLSIRKEANGPGSGSKRKRSGTPSSNSSKPRKKRRNSWSDSDSGEDDNIAVAGVMKPDITFFGEDLPKRFEDRLVRHDRDIVDLVVVIGTSLKVAPVSEVVGIVPANVPQIYINRDPCSHVDFDVDLLGECDTIVQELSRRAGWDLKHDMCKKRDVSLTLVEEKVSQWKVEVLQDKTNSENGEHTDRKLHSPGVSDISNGHSRLPVEAEDDTSTEDKLPRHHDQQSTPIEKVKVLDQEHTAQTDRTADLKHLESLPLPSTALNGTKTELPSLQVDATLSPNHLTTPAMPLKPSTPTTQSTLNITMNGQWSPFNNQNT